MRVSRARAEENHRAVIEAAARLFRERGFDGIGLNGLMNAVGLTRGGFYKHFESKEELVIEASDRALAASVGKFASVVETTQTDPFVELVRGYLSPSHRDSRSDGCALAALSSDVARQGPAVRRCFVAGINAYLDILERAMSAAPGAKRSSPIAALATMVGGLLLSRLVEDGALSTHILDASADSLIGGAAGKTPSK